MSFVQSSTSTPTMLQLKAVLVLWVFATQVYLTGAVISCEVPSVKNDESATITCDLNEDVNKVKKNVKVQHYPVDNIDPDQLTTVADCYWMNSQEFKCSMHEAYIFLGLNGTLAKVGILKASLEHVGKYMCEVVPSDPGNIQPCRFDLKEEPPYLTVDEFDEAFKTVFGVALAALLLSGFVCLFLVAFCIFLVRKRRTCSRTKNQGVEHLTSGNQHEKPGSSGVQNEEKIPLATRQGDKEAAKDGESNEKFEVKERHRTSDDKTNENAEKATGTDGSSCSFL